MISKTSKIEMGLSDMRRIGWSAVLCLILFLIPILAFAAPLPGKGMAGALDDADDLSVPLELLEKGDYRGAAQVLEQDLFPAADPEGDFLPSCKDLKGVLLLAHAYRETGFPGRGLDLLNRGRLGAEECPDDRFRTLYFGLLAELSAGAGNLSGAEKALERAKSAARSAGKPAIAGILLNHMGRIALLKGDRPQALQTFANGIEKIRQAISQTSREREESFSNRFLNFGGTLGGLLARLHLQRAQIFAAAGETEDSVLELMKSDEELKQIPDTYEKGEMLIAAALLAEKLEKEMPIDSLRALRFKGPEKGLQIAEKMENPRLASYALGHLGRLYRENGRHRDALLLTRKAIFQAQQQEIPESLYLWQWQLGALHAEEGDREKALRAYSDAVKTLHPIRGELLGAYRGVPGAFAEKIRPVYLGKARLLIQKAGALKDFEAQQPLLMDAISTMEQLKTAELENFFQDPCVAAAQERQTRLQTPPAGVALFYPIVFSDRVALLLALGDGIYLEMAYLDQKNLQDAVLRFRELLQSVISGNRYFFYARRLQEWLIEPVALRLRSHNIRTLIIAPDGVLRLIPFAALHDGQNFLAQQYTIATVPGLTLTDPVNTVEGRFSTVAQEWQAGLIAGLSEARFGFPPLPAVPQELQGVKRIIGGTLFQDEAYTIDNLLTTFREKEYGVIHLATHGQFGGSAEETFLLTSDGKLTMNRLEQLIHLGRYRKEPVELLTLSACQTAMGDEQAALGLAGVAVKAGAKSALATLWSVDDAATAAAVIAFYRSLMIPGTSKAQALGMAQSELIREERYGHPAFWAPFLLIGNPS